MFLQAPQNAPKSVFSRDCATDPLGKLTTLPIQASWLELAHHPPVVHCMTQLHCRTSLPIPSELLICLSDISQIQNLLLPGVFGQAQNAPKPVFGRGSAPDPAGGAYDAPPDPLIGWGRGTPPPHTLPLDAFGVSISAPTAPRAPPLFWSSLRP